MFNPAEALRDNPALFACYVLFVYFRGQNACRIEREMRGLGYTTFHRRNLYPRGKHPGWVAKHNWHTLFKQDAQDRQDAQGGNPTGREGVIADRQPDRDIETADDQEQHPLHPVHPVKDITQTTESPDFHSWLKRVAPKMTWDWKHQQVIIKQLEQVTAGECKRLMIFLPPRHGKTELVSVKYTAWRMQRQPELNVILGSYNQRLADRMSRKIRTTLCDSEAIRLGADRSADTLVRMSVASTRRESANSPNSSIGQDRLAGGTGDADMSVRAPLSPFPFSRPRPKNAVSEWETAAGGSFRAIGSGSGVTGFGANLIVIDDPVKNRAQAESETFRNRVWDWYKDDLYTRLEPDGSIVLIQTRWHEDDLAGRLLRDDLDNWTVINLPALSEPPASAGGQFVALETSVPPAVAGGLTQPIETSGTPANLTELNQDEQDTHDPSQKSINEHPAHPVHPVKTSSFEWRKVPNIALCPERFPVEALEQQRRQLGTYSFSALYQQRPTPAGGQIFKREWFKQIIDFAPPGLKWKRGYDLAVSTSTESDYTASFRCAFDDKTGNLYISGGFRRRMEFPDQRRYIIDRIKSERDTEHGVELALHGQALLQDLRREPAIRGRSLSGVKVSTDKLTRALTWSPIAEDGKVILVRSAECGVRNTGRNATVRERVDRDVNRNSPPYEGGVAAALGGRGGSLSCDTEISPCLQNRQPNNSTSDTPHSAIRTPHFQDWISDLLDELAAFPNGTHDDQIDAISIAVQMASKRTFRSGGMLVK